MLAVTQAEASSTRFSRITADGKIVWRTEFIGPPPSRRTEQLIDAKPPEYTDPKPFETREPQAFLVEQEAGGLPGRAGSRSNGRTTFSLCGSISGHRLRRRHPGQASGQPAHRSFCRRPYGIWTDHSRRKRIGLFYFSSIRRRDRRAVFACGQSANAQRPASESRRETFAAQLSSQPGVKAAERD